MLLVSLRSITDISLISMARPHRILTVSMAKVERRPQETAAAAGDPPH